MANTLSAKASVASLRIRKQQAVAFLNKEEVNHKTPQMHVVLTVFSTYVLHTREEAIETIASIGDKYRGGYFQIGRINLEDFEVLEPNELTRIELLTRSFRKDNPIF